MKVQELLSNLVFGFLWVKDPEEGVEKISALEGVPEVLYFFLDLLHPDHFRRKEYYHIDRRSAPSRLDAWVYEHLVDEKEYAAYNEHNQFEYIRSYPKILVTPEFGSNYTLDKQLEREVRQAHPRVLLRLPEAVGNILRGTNLTRSPEQREGQAGVDAYELAEVRQATLLYR